MIKLMSKRLLGSKHVRFLIAITIIANCFGLVFPVLGSNDANFYSVIAKHILDSNDWINLTFGGHPWLDKPHFPFWMTAIFYKIFGINTFAYILPGFLFNMLGAYYTYLLAKLLYNKETALIACLFYLTALHLMLSAIDVRAEAFLLGEIMPACYYWLLYDDCEKINIKYLALGSLFTALAIMTKGIFITLPIFGGLIAIWVYTRKFINFINDKWLIAVVLIFIFIIPELAALYLQFDLHPEQIVFGHNHVSGIKFFFWDSQFGRFFSTGPIIATHNLKLENYIYFIHTFAWAFLPWSGVFIVALWNIIKDFKIRDIPQNKETRYNYVYLLGCFLPTFILFSLTPFQLDHYTNILIPFAAIISANWIESKATRLTTHPIFKFQVGLAFLILLIVIILSILIFNGKLMLFILSLCFVVFFLFIALINNYGLTKAVIYPFLVVNLVFMFAILANNKIYAKYDAGYQIANYLMQESIVAKVGTPLIDYNVNLASLEFHTKQHYKRVETEEELLRQAPPYYLVIENSQWQKIKLYYPFAKLLNQFIWIKQERFIPTLFNKAKRDAEINNVLLLSIPVVNVSENDVRDQE